VLAGRLLVLRERLFFRAVSPLQLTHGALQPLQLLADALYFLKRSAEFVGPEALQVAEYLQVLLNVVTGGGGGARHLNFFFQLVHHLFVRKNAHQFQNLLLDFTSIFASAQLLFRLVKHL